MARISKSRPVLLFCSGVAAAICFAGPVAGAARSLFWPYIAGGHTEYAASLRILEGDYWRTYQQGDLPRRDTSLSEGKCQIQFDRQISESSEKNPEKTSILRNLSTAIYSEQIRREANAKQELKLEKLARLPFFTLGAIEGCLGQSALAPLCRIYVRKTIDEPNIRAKRAHENEHVGEDEHMNAAWCAVAGASIYGARG